MQITLTAEGRALSERAAGVPAALLCHYRGDPTGLPALRNQVRDLVGRMLPDAS